MGLLIFLILAAVAVAAALGVAFSRHPIYNVLFLVVTILALAGLFLTLDAEFLAALQVIVYAGAIMVLFLFVIMMLNLAPTGVVPGLLGRPAAYVVGALLLLVLTAAVLASLGGPLAGRTPPPGPSGTVENVGRLLLTRYVLPVELASLLLLAGMVGAVSLSRPWRQPPSPPEEKP